MRVLHVVPSYYPAVRYGGPIMSVKRLCEALACSGVEVDVATTNEDGPINLDVDTSRWHAVDGVNVRYFPRVGKGSYAFSLELARYVMRNARKYDLVHSTSTFTFPSLVASLAAASAGKPSVVSPRGSLQDWSLAQKRWKKAPYWLLLERRRLRNTTLFHATSDMEVKAIQGIVPGARVVSIPNGVDAVHVEDVERQPERIVFLGRLHRKKGFDVLVPALAKVAAVRPDTETIVAGPDDTGEWLRVQGLLASSSPTPRVSYVGSVNGDERFKLLASASAFVLPSHSENFGQAVVEALACGTPVVVSQNCPWEIVERAGAGYWVQNTPESVASALLRILESPSLGARMALSARALSKNFDWLRVGAAMTSAYRQLLPQDDPTGLGN
jgi:glycosyltransferase involved in cell wall biosynthesis